MGEDQGSGGDVSGKALTPHPVRVLFEVREDPLPVLLLGGIGRGPGPEHVQRVVVQVHASGESPPVLSPSPLLSSSNLASPASKSSRSEERRVGQECVSTCRYRWP